ncbi:MAG: aminopeptidase [Armatimonadota bacterium]
MAEQMQNYADLIVRAGVNVQPGQLLVVNAPIECAPFARLLCEKAYDAGAGDVHVFWNDELLRKLRLERADIPHLEDVPPWLLDARLYYVKEKGACVISIYAEDPDLLQNIDPDKAAAEHKAMASLMKPYRRFMMGNQARWCVVSVPTVGWATKVFPNLSNVDAVQALQQAIYQASRADVDDPVAAWKQHTAQMQARLDRMNNYRFSALHYTSGNGTDFTIGLADDHIWCGGIEYDPQHTQFSANIPTEEIFTAPHRDRADGIVKGSKPLLYNGILIQDLSLTFKDGRVVDFSARENAETLGHLLETDEGSRHLGEIALVPYDSPISNMGILFYNTLFDENAACHFALGEAYPTTIGGEDRSEEALKQKGLNTSLSHEDFMVGAADTNIDGITASGERIPVFRDGNFVF